MKMPEAFKRAKTRFQRIAWQNAITGSRDTALNHHMPVSLLAKISSAAEGVYSQPRSCNLAAELRASDEKRIGYATV